MIVTHTMSQSGSQCYTVIQTFESLADQRLGLTSTVIQTMLEFLGAQSLTWFQPISDSPVAEGLYLTHLCQASGSVLLMITTKAFPGYFPCRILGLEREVTVPPIARMEHMRDQMLINLTEAAVVSLSKDTLRTLTQTMLADVHGLHRTPRDRGRPWPEGSALFLAFLNLDEVFDSGETLAEVIKRIMRGHGSHLSNASARECICLIKQR